MISGRTEPMTTATIPKSSEASVIVLKWIMK